MKAYGREQLNVKKYKGFFIAVIDDKGSLNRQYSDFVLAFLKQVCTSISNEQFEFIIDRHDEKQSSTIRQGLLIEMSRADYFVILADSFMKDNVLTYNPNVWFELGIASTMEKPVIMIAREGTDVPFDTSDLNAVYLLDSRYKGICSHPDISRHYVFSNVLKAVKDWLGDENTFEAAIRFFDELKNRFVSIIDDNSSPFQALYDHAMLKNKFGYSGLSQLLDQVLHGGSEFISGEENAFEALTEAVTGARKSLFTSRFANQSIVTNSKGFHEKFVNTLYATSSKVDVCERIICNNSPYKWRDVFYALVNSDTKMRVYVRAASFSTHFELVIIDDEVGFIHFYDRSMAEYCDDRDIHLPDRKFTQNGDFVEEQVINSTFRLRGEVCQKLKSVFVRFHHKAPHRISHTILGVNDSNEIAEDAIDNGIGVFQLQGEYGTSESDKNRKRCDAFDMLVKAYKNCYKNAADLNPSPNFNAEDAWNMYYGLKCLSDELGRSIDIDEPKVVCPEKVTLLYDPSK